MRKWKEANPKVIFELVTHSENTRVDLSIDSQDCSIEYTLWYTEYNRKEQNRIER